MSVMPLDVFVDEPLWGSQSSTVIASADRASMPIPPDYSARLGRLVALGWPAAIAAQALDAHQFNAGPARSWLQLHHPLKPAIAAAAAASSSSVAAAAPSIAAPCRYERLPPPVRNDFIIASQTAASASSSAPSSAASSLSHSGSSPALSPYLGPASVPAATSSMVWSCAACTMENVLAATRCEICDTPHVPSVREQALQSNLLTCGICFEAVPRESIFAPDSASSCGHYFCVSCFQQYLQSKVDSGQLANLSCCGDKCTRQLTDAELQSGVSPYDLARVRRFQRLHALSTDPHAVFCSTRDCSVVLFGGPDRTQLTCPDCLSSVCFSCRVPWHSGQTCSEFILSESVKSESAKAAQLVSGEQAFQHFLQTSGTFRQCRQCAAWIEKTEGCDKMTCRCGYRSCFKCGSEGAKCGCTPANHVFFSHEAVKSNWTTTRW